MPKQKNFRPFSCQRCLLLPRGGSYYLCVCSSNSHPVSKREGNYRLPPVAMWSLVAENKTVQYFDLIFFFNNFFHYFILFEGQVCVSQSVHVEGRDQLAGSQFSFHRLGLGVIGSSSVLTLLTLYYETFTKYI